MAAAGALTFKAGKNMKMNPTDRMKDPFYAGLLFQIENIICQADDDAVSRRIQLTDSQVRSALIKTQKKLQGGDPEIPETTEREQVMALLINSLINAPSNLKESGQEVKPIDLQDWLNALDTVEDSINTRKSSIPGSRVYLNFIHGFIDQAKGRK